MVKSVCTAKTVAGCNRQVWSGKAKKTKSGLSKKDLKKSKSGKIVSKKKSLLGKKRGGPLKAWRDSVKKACEELKVPYEVAPKKGTDLYVAARKIYDASKTKSKSKTKSAPKKKSATKSLVKKLKSKKKI